MKHLGDFDTSTVIYGKFTSYQPSTGACFALAGTPALSVYKDNSTTESTTGVTLTASFDSRTGLNHYAIDTSSDGTFYSAGSFFDIVITTGTVDSVSVVGAVIGSFSLRKTSALKPATAGRTLVVDASGLADANAVKVGPTGSGTAQTARDIGASVLLSTGTGTGQLDFTAGVVKSNLAQILGTALTETAGQIAGAFKKFFNVAAPVLTCLGIDQTGDSYARIGAAGAGITAIGDTRIANLDVAVSTRNATAPPSAATISAAVVDQALSGHTTTGTVGAALQAAGSAGDPWATALPGAYASGAAGNIVGNSLNATVGSRLATSGYTAPDNADIVAIKAKTDNLPASPAAVSDIPTANANADALLDRTAGVETSRTPRQALRLMLAAMAGKLSGAATTTVTIRDTNDTKDRITATVDANGNRSAVTYDAS